MRYDQFVEDYPAITDSIGQTFNLVKVKNDKLLAWEKDNENGAVLRILDVDMFNKEALEELNIFEQLSEEAQKVINSDNNLCLDSNVGEEPEKIVKKKRERKTYDKDLPSEIECIKCGHKQVMVKSYIEKKLDKLGITIEEYVKEWKCQKCKPTRGRKAKDYGDIPDKLVCVECGKENSYHPSAIINIAKNKGITVKEVISSYKCRKCNPPRGRKKSKRV